jgi:hypothetical protein
LSLPAGSDVYVYMALSDGADYSLTIKTESGTINLSNNNYLFGTAGNVGHNPL